MALTPPPRYTLTEKASLIEQVIALGKIAEVAHTHGIGVNTLSKWVSDYLGYRGKEGITITLPSKLNDITVTSDIIENQ